MSTESNALNQLSRFATLTQREKEVFKMLAEGNSVKDVACQLNLSVKTDYRFVPRDLCFFTSPSLNLIS